jgi:aminopeptidase-like protein
LGVSRLRYSYRYLFIPGTIGSITWLARNQASAERSKHGLVLTCVGDAGHATYPRSRRGDAEVDRAIAQVLHDSGQTHEIQDFSPWGYDERQYCSPGFNLPVGCLMRTPHGRFPEYHTSADDLEFVRAEALADSFANCLRLFGALERNRTYLNTNPNCEPQLGKRGLYGAIGGQADREQAQLAMLWVLNQSDGDSDLLAIAEKSSLPFEQITRAAAMLREHGLLVEAPS